MTSEYSFRNTTIHLSHCEDCYSIILEYKGKVTQTHKYHQREVAVNSYDHLCSQLPKENLRLRDFLAHSKLTSYVMLSDTSCQIDSVNVTMMNDYLYVETEDDQRVFHYSAVIAAICYVKEYLKVKRTRRAIIRAGLLRCEGIYSR